MAWYSRFKIKEWASHNQSEKNNKKNQTFSSSDVVVTPVDTIIEKDDGTRFQKNAKGAWNKISTAAEVSAHADALTDARRISLGGDATGYADFDGSQDVTIPVTITTSYNNLTNKPTIPTVPTNISAFTNDSGYLTSHQDLTAYATQSYVNTAVSNLVNGANASFDTLKEIQDAMATDAELATAISNLSSSTQTYIDTAIANNSGSSVTVSSTAPSNSSEGDMWWDDVDGLLNVYYDGVWVEASPASSSVAQGAGSGLDADLLDGYDSSEFKKLKWRSFTVPGDINTFWPVLFQVSAAGNHAEEMIEIANTNVHDPSSGFGAFYIKFGANVTGWGHLNQMFNIYSYTRGGSNTYISKIRDVDHATNRIGVWLRGGSSYVYRTDHDVSPTVVTTDNYMSYDNSNNTYDVTVSSTTTIEDAAFTEASRGGLRWQVTADVNGNVDIPGNITATGDVTAYSDDSLKTNVQPIQGALDKVEAVRGVTFERIEDGSVSTGVVAQELEAVLPEAVKTDDAGLKHVAYGNITGLLIEAVKELDAKYQDQIKQLTDQIEELKRNG